MDTQSRGGQYKGYEDYVGGNNRNEADGRRNVAISDGGPMRRRNSRDKTEDVDFDETR